MDSSFVVNPRVISYIWFFIKNSNTKTKAFSNRNCFYTSCIRKKNYLVWNFSFPSFQAMLAFCAVPILAKEFPRFKYVWIIFAGLVAFSRVYFGVHFLSDVIAGGIIGYLLGIIVVKLEKEKKFGEKIMKILKK